MIKVMLLVVQMKDSNGMDYWLTVPIKSSVTELYDAWLVGDAIATDPIPVFDHGVPSPSPQLTIQPTIPNLGRSLKPISKAELRAVFIKMNKFKEFKELFQ